MTTDIVKRLQAIEQELGELIMDEQRDAEADGHFSSGHPGICVPEDAAPELDSARTHVQDAIDYLKEQDNG